MDIKEAKKVLTEYANNRLNEINNMDFRVASYYFSERKSMERLIEILEFSI